MKKILGVELSHQNAPIAIRELAALNKEQVIRTLRNSKKDYDEAFIVSTCNRLAYYGVGESLEPMIAFFKTLGVGRRFLNILPDSELTIGSLFSTAAGLESQAIGEHQILGQIKTAFELAEEAGTDGPITNQLVGHAIHAGRRVRKETNIGKYSASLATVGFELINKHEFVLTESTMLVIGTGNMANLVTTILDRTGIKKLYVASHDSGRAESMARQWGGEAITMHDIHRVLFSVDIVIGGTQGEVNLLSEQDLESSKCTRAQLAYNEEAQKLLIDFGVPRNFNEELKELNNVHLYDLDDIKELTFESLQKRYDEIPQAKMIVEEEAHVFTKWLTDRQAAPMIESYWNQLESIKDDELNWLMPKLGELSEEQRQLLEKFTHRMMRRFTNTPFKELKKMVEDPEAESEKFKAARDLLDLKGYPVELPKKTIIVGTRGSKLALTQSYQAIQLLRNTWPEVDFQIKVVETSGDLGNIDEIGAFTNAIQRKILSGEVDMAVHSYKDLPTEKVEGLRIAAILERQDARDVFLSNKYNAISELPAGAIVGTGSPRRAAQLKQLKPDLEIKHIQGNIDSRIAKMEAGDYDGIILAAAGLIRMDMLDAAKEIIDFDAMLPAPGQGAIALECSADNKEIEELLAKVNNESAWIAVHTERLVLELIGGGCSIPLGCYAHMENNTLDVNAVFFSEDNQVRTVQRSGSADSWKEIAADVASELKQEVKAKKKVLISEAATE